MGKRITAAIRLLLILAVACFWLIPAIPVFATTIEDPVNFVSGDPIPLSNIFVNRNIISPGDMVVYFAYNIKYNKTTTSTSNTTTNGYSANTTGNITTYTGSTSNTTTSAYETNGLPIIAADQTFTFQLIDTDGTTVLGWNKVFPYREGGYNTGFGAIYLSPDDAPAWAGNYTLAIQGDPDYFVSAPNYHVTLSEDNYSDESTQTANQNELQENILTILNTLQMDWGIALTVNSGQQTVLTSAGSSYLIGCMPGIQYVLTDLFTSYLSEPDYDSAHTWGTNQAVNYTQRYSGYSWVGNFTAGVGSLAGGSSNMGAGMIIAGLAIACVIWAAMKYQSPLSGFIGAILVLMCGFLVGWLPAVWFGIVAFLMIVYTSTVLWLQRS